MRKFELGRCGDTIFDEIGENSPKNFRNLTEKFVRTTSTICRQSINIIPLASFSFGKVGVYSA